MCYDVETQLRRQLKKAVEAGAPSEEIDFLEHKIKQFVSDFGEDELSKNEHHWTMGFQHQKIPVITDEDPDNLQFFHWGLIPFWVKDKVTARKIANNCLNARSETMFDKPSFRAAAKERRCVIPLSGYYEHHWVDSKGKNKVPYFIKHKNGSPLFMAGLWETWLNKETGEEVQTCTIATTKANNSLSRVHNRKLGDPRMLVILPFENVSDWLSPIEGNADIELLEALCIPYPDELLELYPVAQLRGKNGVGDIAEATEPFDYGLIGLP